MIDGWFVQLCRILARGAAWNALAVVVLTAAHAETPTSEQIEFFESKVRPILVEHCYECHSVDADELEGGLLLDSMWGWETGGDSGPAIEPGNLDESLLIEAIRYQEDVVSGMPPRSKLPAKKISILEQWVKMGAPDPRPKAIPKDAAPDQAFDVEDRFAQHWSWRPVSPSPLPEVSDDAWPLNEIDRFVLARLEQAGLRPADDASKRLWLRRVYFDLIGLPPTTEQIAKFVEDPSDEAHERVVTELLDSPHFGEKWARHWMDLIRYAETYGHEFDYPLNHAHEYRDYLIRAFNADVPYDLFVREHIAGDLIPEPRRHPEFDFNESVIGTGFWYLHEATHAPTDVLGNEADIVDNQLDVFGKAFLGLTVACARCHDHKFDAISTADYYALSAYLQSSCRQDVPLDVHRKAETAKREIDQLRDRAGQQLRSIDWQTEVNLRCGVYYQAATSLLRSVGGRQPVHKVDAKKVTEQAVAKAASTHDLDASRLRLWVDNVAGVMAELAKTQASGKQVASEPNDGAIVFTDFDGDRLPEGWTTSGLAFQPVGPSLALSADGRMASPGTVASNLSGKKQTGILRSPTFEITTNQIHLRMKATANITVRLIVDNYYMAHYNGLLFRGTFLNGKATDTQGKWAWKSLGGDLRKYVGHKAYLELIDNGEAALEVDQIVFSNGPPSAEPAFENIPHHAAFFDHAWREAIGQVRRGSPSPLVAAMLESNLLTLDQLDPQVGQWLQQARQLDGGLPAPRFAVAMAEGTPEQAHVYIRGSHVNLGQSVSARFLEALGGRTGDRLALANQIASVENPLTARVIVNRIWHHLTGRGIVPTVDDFGPQGQPASHPELLDWLAADFVENGWSLKHAIQRMVLSRTYRQSSVAHRELDAEAIAQTDPTNRLLHRMSVRRLPSESIRDAILLVSGRLDPTQFGPSVATHRTPFMTGRGARASGPLDGAGRRSVYLSVYRNFLNPFMLTFDTPSPFGPQGRRSRSNVPAQALTLMNDPFVVQQAGIWAEDVLRQPELDDRQRIARMVEQAHGEEADDQQIEKLYAFVNQQAQIYGKLDQRAWADLGHVLWNIKAFYFLR